jgi:hypothetical protein
MLVISLIFAALPLLGVAYIVLAGSPFTVDGLFTSLILLAISGTFGLNVLLELFGKKREPGGAPGLRGVASGSASALVRRGKVQGVNFYEANVGQANKSLVTLLDGNNSQLLVLDGDVRNALPVGQTVEVALRRHGQQNVLVNVNYV